MNALRKELRGAPHELPEAVEDLAESGLRYAVIVAPGGHVIADGGTPSEPLEDLLAAVGDRPPKTPEVLPDGNVRVVGHARPPRGRGPRPRARPPRVIIEFEPTLADSMAAHATSTLVASAVAAFVLLLLGGVLWRLMARADRDAAERHRDKHLRSLGEMSAVLGHELRNPLASLKGHAQLLVEKLPEDDPARTKAERVVREAVRLERLTNEVLEFARSGEPDRQPTDPAAVARAAVEQVDGAIALELAADLPERFALDAPRMVQVLSNLLRNARLAAPDEAPVQLLVFTRPDGTLVLAVRDTGPGFVPGDEERVFQPFYTRRTQGTGLGLAGARRIVEGHGGTITAANRPEGGAEVRVVLPAG